jgi:hypothetical protein
LALSSLLFSACSSQPQNPSLNTRLKLAADRLTFVYFFTPGWPPWIASQPIVNGLEEKYGSRIAFLRVDASTQEGQRAFTAARLAGHPGFLILKPDGSELWRAVGEQTESALSTGIENSLSQTPSS